MMIVVDASIAVAWCLRDEKDSVLADSIMAEVSSGQAVVPGLFWYEVRNVLAVAERKGRIAAEESERHLRRLRILPMTTDHEQDDRQTLILARRHTLSGYDAAYLETALRRGGALATLDNNLAAAAEERGVAHEVD